MAKDSKKVYIAPSVFTAFINRADPKHAQASAFFRYFAQENYKLYSDFLDIHETARKIHREISPSLSRDFLRTIFFSNINIIYPQESDIKGALKTLVNYQSVDLTFEKALMATLANKASIPQICTFEYMPSLFGLNTFYLPL